MYKIISFLTLIAASSAQYLPNGCPSDFQVHILLPHESDCSKYYSCSNGKKIEMSCEPGTLYDVNMQVCNWAFQIDCPHPPSSSSSTTTIAAATTTTSFDHTIQGSSTTTGEPTLSDGSTTTAGDSTMSLTTQGSTTGEQTPPDGCTTTERSTTTGDDTTVSTTTQGSTTEDDGPCPPDAYGNVPHPDEYNAFYLCVSGVAVKSYCASGYEFDATVRTCVVIAEGGCTLGSGSTTGPVTTPDGFQSTTTMQTTTDSNEVTGSITVNGEENCRGQKVLIPCTTGMCFDCTIQGSSTTTGEPTLSDGSTTTAGDSTMSLTTQGSTTGEQTPPDGCTTTERSTTTGDDTTVSTTTQGSTTEDDGPCPPDAYGNVPHPDEYNAFYLCVSGVAVKSYCASGYEFDATVRSCVPIAEEGSTMSQTTTLAPTTSSTSTTPPETTTVDPNCLPGTWGDVPHPELCNSFYSCTGGHAIQLFCTEGFEFDPKHKTCVVIAEGGCTLGSATTPEGPSTTENIVSSTTLANVATASAPALDETICGCVEIAEGGCTFQSATTTGATTIADPPIYAEGQYLNIPHPELCNSFYSCTGGQAVQRFCSEGFEFDPNVRECVRIAEGGCTLGSQTTPAVDVTTTSSSELPDTTTERDPDDFLPGDVVTTTERGVTSTSEPTTTAASSTSSDVDDVPTEGSTTIDYETTTLPTTYGTTTEAPICASDMFGNVPHPDRCEIFYLCSGGNALLFTCSEGLEFDRETRVCVPFGEGKCTLPQRSGQKTEAKIKLTTEAWKTTVNFMCPDNEDRFLADPNNCDKFFRCVEGYGIQMHCPNGQEYDASGEKCVAIAKGGCSYNKRQEIKS
ncbi:mucin-5AC-like [Spodoptera litura]|uniref:Mucin-5AC-like n=1 Tax=Spodoptera litura TaxID=69820 RepID=A0A9J7DT69_SPOLT|nr:mucin-5AC-like [Spodoptera litura]